VAELDTFPRFLPDEIGPGLVEFEGDSDRRPVASDGAGGTHDQRRWRPTVRAAPTTSGSGAASRRRLEDQVTE
jgi:hypothetical protein